MGNGDKFRDAYDDAPIPVTGVKPTVPTAQPVFNREVTTPVPVRKGGGLVADEKGDITFKNFALTAKGLDIRADLSLEEWEGILKTAARVQSSLAWIIGDAMLYGSHRFGKEAKDVAALVGRSTKTIQNWTSVCASIEFSRRREKLHFSIHAVLTAMEPELQDQWLDYAEANRLSRRRLEADIEESSGGNGGNIGALIDKSNRKAFNRIWRDLSTGRTPNPDLIAHLRRWLDALEHTDSPAPPQ